MVVIPDRIRKDGRHFIVSKIEQRETKNEVKLGAGRRKTSNNRYGRKGDLEKIVGRN